MGATVKFTKAEDGFSFSERHIPAVRDAIGSIPTRVFLDIETASAEKDMHEATDLIIRVTGGDIGVRVRGRDRLWDTPEWSVRVRARWGGKTEIHKLDEGYCRWYFTSYSDGKDGLYLWWLLDMDAIRASKVLYEEWPVHPNGDGSAGMYIPISRLEELHCVAHCGGDTLREAA